MPIQTLQATSFSNSGMSSPTNNSHASTGTSWSDPPTGTDSKSIQWQGFPSVPGIVKSVRLKFDYNRNGSIAGNGFNQWFVTINGEEVISQISITDNVSGSVDYLMITPVRPNLISGVFESINSSVFVGGFGGG